MDNKTVVVPYEVPAGYVLFTQEKFNDMCRKSDFLGWLVENWGGYQVFYNKYCEEREIK